MKNASGCMRQRRGIRGQAQAHYIQSRCDPQLSTGDLNQTAATPESPSSRHQERVGLLQRLLIVTPVESLALYYLGLSHLCAGFFKVSSAK